MLSGMDEVSKDVYESVSACGRCYKAGEKFSLFVRKISELDSKAKAFEEISNLAVDPHYLSVRCRDL